MKSKLFFLSLAICGFFSLQASAINLVLPVSKSDALSIAKRQFQNSDVDYYLLEDDSETEWTIFVDAEPMKGWEHQCLLLATEHSTADPKNCQTKKHIKL